MYPNRARLEGLEMEIFKLVSYSATPEQWKEWLRVPLEHAAARGNLDLFNRLLGAGADGSAGYRGCEDRTLLDAAAVGRDVEVLSTLLLAGAQPDVNVVSCSSKRSALYTASVMGHEASARRLVIAGADVHFLDPVRQSSVLHEAILGGQEQLVAELLMGGANPNCRDGVLAVSALHVAAMKGFHGIVSTLLLRGADKDALDMHSETPLMWASRQGRLSAVKTLLTAGANVHGRDFSGRSALDYAATKGHVDVIEVIAGHGVDVNAGDDEGFTTLHIAARYDQEDAVNALVEAGAEIDVKETECSWTPLASAAYNSSCKAMLALLQHGAKVDVRDTDGDAPLHLACFGRSVGLETSVDLLLRWGADETALNNDGQSPVELLAVEIVGGDNNKHATQNTIERTRLLLARAPADRAWRRRGWLVILRSRAEKARVVSSCDSGDAAGAGSDEGKSRKEARRDGGGRQSHGVDARGGAGGDKTLSDVVALLTALEMEGVFRTVVGFL